jgi:Raf kinase inhibitor-like YbhB/YbcL family protein
MSFTVRSAAFNDGDPIPRQFTCDGENVPPPLEWSGAPDETSSFALIMDDPDAPGGTFTHWILYDIPLGTPHWPAGSESKTLLNSFKRSGYAGPCPPRGHGPHHYVFTVYAVDVRNLELTGDRLADLRAALDAHTLATAQLTGLYERAA